MYSKKRRSGKKSKQNDNRFYRHKNVSFGWSTVAAI